MTRCRWIASDQPRILVGRHTEVCDTDECRGCQPCTLAHCDRCGREHVDQLVCPGCIADARDDLAEILRLCRALPVEVKHRGIESEAMNLLGPVADPETIGHVRASVAVGRIPIDWLDAADDDLHPLTVLGTWAEAYIEALDHTEPARITVTGSASYLDRNLAYVAQLPDVPFADLARDLAACRRHIERVLHDGEQVEISRVSCIEQDCTGNLVRVYATDTDHDGWRCSRNNCRSAYDHARYARAMHQQLASTGAEKWVRISEALAVIPRPEQTLRTWVRNETVRHYRDATTGQVYVWWPDVRERHIEAQKRNRRPNPIRVVN